MDIINYIIISVFFFLIIYMINYQYKYYQYKKKYLDLKNQCGGGIENTQGIKVIQPKSIFLNPAIHAQKIPVLGAAVSDVLTKHCERFKETTNAKERIKSFANNFKIDHTTIEICKDIENPDDCWSKFNTPNDFFIRERAGLPKTKSKYSVVSPADCYCVYLPKAEKSNVWIKGTNFTPQKLMGENISFDNNSLLVFRLAPQHYHRYHCPVNGRVLSITKLGKEKYSVDPIIVKSSIDVYSNNVRLIMKIELENKKIAYLAIIGATCVASIEITNKSIVDAFNKKYNNQDKLTDVQVVNNNNLDFTDMDVNIETNQELGNFQYGGSTLVLIHPSDYELTDNGKIIEKNSSRLACDNSIKAMFKKLFSFIYTFEPNCVISPVETEITVGYDIYN